MHLLLNLSPEAALLSRVDPGRHEYKMNKQLIEEIEKRDLVSTAKNYVGGAAQKAANSLLIMDGKLTGQLVLEALEAKAKIIAEEKADRRTRFVNAVANAKTWSDCNRFLPDSNCTTWESNCAAEFPDVDLTRIRDLQAGFRRQTIIDFCETVESGEEPRSSLSIEWADSFPDLRERLSMAIRQLAQMIKDRQWSEEQERYRQAEKQAARKKQADIEAKARQKAREEALHGLVEYLDPTAVDQFEAGLLAEGEFLRLIEAKLRATPGAEIGKRLRLTDSYGDKFKVGYERKTTVAEYAAMKSLQKLFHDSFGRDKVAAIAVIRPVSFTLYQKFEKAWEIEVVVPEAGREFKLYFEPGGLVENKK